jgi:hypothetical protein
VITTDAEIDAAIATANAREAFRPKAVAVSFDRTRDAIQITLESGVQVMVPRRLLQGLEDVSPDEAANVELWGPGTSLHWESLDLDHSIPSLLDGLFGDRDWMRALGKRGGAATSTAKARAARKNGAKGGRPTKTAPR